MFELLSKFSAGFCNTDGRTVVNEWISAKRIKLSAWSGACYIILWPQGYNPGEMEDTMVWVMDIHLPCRVSARWFILCVARGAYCFWECAYCQCSHVYLSVPLLWIVKWRLIKPTMSIGPGGGNPLWWSAWKDRRLVPTGARGRFVLLNKWWKKMPSKCFFPLYSNGWFVSPHSLFTAALLKQEVGPLNWWHGFASLSLPVNGTQFDGWGLPLEFCVCWICRCQHIREYMAEDLRSSVKHEH